MKGALTCECPAERRGASPATEETDMRGFGWRHRSRSILLILSFCSLVSGAALATDGDGAAIEGRWETARKDLLLDISRCGQGYCGQLVAPGNRCGPTVLTVVMKAAEPPYPVFTGDFAPPNGSRPGYKVRVSVTMAGETPIRMSIIGDTVDPDPMRRSFAYRALLTRVGDAACSSGTTS